MQIGSDCSGPCLLCTAQGGCLAGHGDDDFCEISKDEALKRHTNGRWLNLRGSVAGFGRLYTQEELARLWNHAGERKESK